MDDEGFKEYQERTDLRLNRVEKEIFYGNGTDSMKTQVTANTKFREKLENIAMRMTVQLIMQFIQVLLLLGVAAYAFLN